MRRFADWSLLTTLLLPVIVLLVPPLFSARSFYHEDLATYFYGLRGQLATSIELLKQGHSLAESLPLWNPNSGMGLPLWADIQLAPLYPLNGLFYVLSTPRAFAWYYFLHFTLLTLFSYQLLRFMDRSKAAAIFGAWIFVWSGWFWAHLHHATFIAAGTWIPMILHGTLETVRLRRGWAPRVWVGTSLMSLAGGSPQLLYYTLLVSTCLCFTQAWQDQSFREGLRLRLAWCLSVLLGVGVGAVQWLPFLYASQEKYSEPLSALEYSSSFALPITALVRTLLPQYFGNDFFGDGGGGGYLGPSTYWESWCYLGMLTLPLTVLGLRRRGVEGFFSGVLGGSLLASLGKLGGLHFLLMLLPFYERMRAPSRWFLFTTLAAAVLASKTLDELQLLLLKTAHTSDREAWSGQREKLRKAARFFLILGLEVLGIAFMLGMVGASTFAPVVRDGFILAAINLGLCYLLLRACAAGFTEHLVGARESRRMQFARTLPWLALVLLCVDFMPILFRYNLTVPDDEILKRPALIQALDARMDDTRMLSDRSAPVYLLNAGLEYGVATVRSYNPLNSGRVQRFLEEADGTTRREGGISLRIEKPDAPMLRLLAARWHVLGKPSERPSLRLAWSEASRGQFLYEDAQAYPRVWWTPVIHLASSESQLWEQTRQLALLGKREAVVHTRYGLPHTSAERSSEVARTQLMARMESSTRTRVTGQADGPGMVVFADVFASGWRVTINGAPAQLVPAFDTLRSFYISKEGPFEAVIEYEPRGLKSGALISLLCLLLYLLLYLLFYLRPFGLLRWIRSPESELQSR